MSVEQAVRTGAAERGRSPAPAPSPSMPAARFPRPAGRGREVLGRGFRTGLLLSLAAHAAIAACFARDLFLGRPPAPRPLLVSTGIEAVPLLDPDPEPLEVTPPVVSRPTVLPTDLREDLPDPVDPRMARDPEPPGPPAGVIGVLMPGGRRSGFPGGRGGGGGGGRTDRVPPGPVEGSALPETTPAPPAREEEFVAARLRTDATPVYPARARERGMEGSVYLRIEVSPEGKVSGVAVERSSGVPSLDDAAVRAAEAWTFEPATEGGKPVASTVHRRVTFHL